MTYDEMIAVIQAAKEGKAIEQYRRGRHDLGPWEPRTNGMMFDFVNYLYRIKPEPPKPREWWFVEYSLKFGLSDTDPTPYATREICEQRGRMEHKSDFIRAVRYVPDEQQPVAEEKA